MLVVYGMVWLLVVKPGEKGAYISKVQLQTTFDMLSGFLMSLWKLQYFPDKTWREKTTVRIDGRQTVGPSQLSAVSESGIDPQDGWDHAASSVRN